MSIVCHVVSCRYNEDNRCGNEESIVITDNIAVLEIDCNYIERDEEDHSNEECVCDGKGCTYCS